LTSIVCGVHLHKRESHVKKRGTALRAFLVILEDFSSDSVTRS
jgi:hypothetical protein